MSSKISCVSLSVTKVLILPVICFLFCGMKLRSMKSRVLEKPDFQGKFFWAKLGKKYKPQDFAAAACGDTGL